MPSDGNDNNVVNTFQNTFFSCAPNVVLLYGMQGILSNCNLENYVKILFLYNKFLTFPTKILVLVLEVFI